MIVWPEVGSKDSAFQQGNNQGVYYERGECMSKKNSRVSHVNRNPCFQNPYIAILSRCNIHFLAMESLSSVVALVL